MLNQYGSSASPTAAAKRVRSDFGYITRVPGTTIENVAVRAVYLRVILREQSVEREHFGSGDAHASTAVAGRWWSVRVD